VSVDYGAVLFELAPLGAAQDDDLAASSGLAGAAGHATVGQGLHAIIAPTDGVFYRAASPGAAPFVAVGDRLAVGRPVGLIEVMKTFNQIVYGGPGYPPEAEVVEIRALDVGEVRAGDVLVVVR